MTKYRIGIGSSSFESIEVEANDDAEAKELALQQTTLDEPFVESVQLI